MRSVPRKILGVTAALLTVFVVGLTTAPAYAAPGATGHLVGGGVSGATVILTDGSKGFTSLIPIKLDKGGILKTYCIDQKIETAPAAAMVEGDWAEYPSKGDKFTQPDKVNWILHHSYPDQKDLSALAKVALVSGKLTPKEAIGGTQAAIWHFSNGVGLAPNGNDPKIVALYKYLTGLANIGETAQPAPALDITPDHNTGKAGDLIGPFVIKTSEKSVPLTLKGPAGVKLVNLAGNAVSSAINGSKVYIKAPSDAQAGKATITSALKSADIQTGRLFRGDGVVTQTLITATSSPVSVEKTVWGSWTKGDTHPSPSPSTGPSQSPSTPPSVSPSTSPAAGNLPVTGTNVALFAGAGAVLLLLGGGMFFVARKRRSA
jgi:TQXA domain-containing protein/LPXTG-motif cell wall-anchored protein